MSYHASDKEISWVIAGHLSWLKTYKQQQKFDKNVLLRKWFVFRLERPCGLTGCSLTNRPVFRRGIKKKNMLRTRAVSTGTHDRHRCVAVFTGSCLVTGSGNLASRRSEHGWSTEVLELSPKSTRQHLKKEFLGEIGPVVMSDICAVCLVAGAGVLSSSSCSSYVPDRSGSR